MGIHRLLHSTCCFLNTNTAITWQLIRTARTLEAEWWQVLRGSVGTGTKDDESSTGHVWAAGFHHVTTSSRLAHFETYEPFISSIFHFFPGHVKPQITETADTGVRLLMEIEFKKCASCNEAEQLNIVVLLCLLAGCSQYSLFLRKTHLPAEFCVVFHVICCGMQILHILYYF